MNEAERGARAPSQPAGPRPAGAQSAHAFPYEAKHRKPLPRRMKRNRGIFFNRADYNSLNSNTENGK